MRHADVFGSFGQVDYSDHQPTYSLDPVCGIKLDEAKAAGRTGYAGAMYYFCSVDCQKKFEDHPGLYIRQPRQKHA
jgi:YHS domain-containing protein